MDTVSKKRIKENRCNSYGRTNNKCYGTNGGEQAIATYASIGYVMSIIYLILQGVGDGSQPIMSKYYGEKAFDRLKNIMRLANGSGILLSCLLYTSKHPLGCIIAPLEKLRDFSKS